MRLPPRTQRVLSDPAAPPSAIAWAVFGGALAAALMGLGDDVASIVARGQQVEHKVDGLLRYLTAYRRDPRTDIGGRFRHRRGSIR